ncbi:MAG: ComEC/Rec2 family competence protein [Leptospiraceae bacterium]|nr:ComEC/Rec2 family competence protein [Leptospiraceae bacterium]
MIFQYGILYYFQFDLKLSFYLFFSTLILVLVLLFLQKKVVFINEYLIPKRKGNLLWIVFFMLFFVGISYYKDRFWTQPKETQNSDLSYEEYEIIKNYRFGYTYYATGKIQKVLYPGMYLTEISLDKIEVFYKKNKTYQKDDTYKNFIGKTLKTSLQSERKDLWEGCQVQLWFYGKVFFYPLKDNHAFFQYLKNQGAQYYFKIKEKNIQSVDCPQNISIQVKDALIDMIETKVSEKHHQGIILGLILGNSNWMEKEKKDQIKKLGLMHLFAASGLHLGILFFVIYFPLSRLFGRKHFLSFLLPLPILFFYLHVLNFPYTLVRAYLFVIIVFVLTIVHKKQSVYDLLTNTFLLMILIFPYSVLNLSTGMSFAAVSGILILYKKLEDLFLDDNIFPKYNRLQNLKYFVIKFAIVQFLIGLSASFFILPIQFFVFREYSLLSPVYNFVMVPIVGFFLPIVFNVLIVSLIFKDVFYINSIIDFLWDFINIFMIGIDFLIQTFSKTILWMRFSESWNLAFYLSIGFILAFLYLLRNENHHFLSKLHQRNKIITLYLTFHSLLFVLYFFHAFV